MADIPIDDMPEHVRKIHCDLCLKLSGEIVIGGDVWNDLLIQIQALLKPAEVAPFETPPNNQFRHIWNKLQEKGIIGVGNYKFLVEMFKKYIPLVTIINKASEEIRKELERPETTLSRRHKTGEWYKTQYAIYIMNTKCIEVIYEIKLTSD